MPGRLNTSLPEYPSDYSISILSHNLERSSGHHRWLSNHPFPPCPISAALVELTKSIPVHSLTLSSRLFFYLPLLFFPFTVPCRVLFPKPEDLETWPNHLSFCFWTRVRSSRYSPMAAWIFLRASSLETWFLYKMFIAFGSISSQRPAFFSLTLLSKSKNHRHTEIWK